MKDKSPILIIAFNRPQHAKKIFQQIRLYKPQKLYIAIDGPRKTVNEDEKKIRDTIKVFQIIDWACEVKTLIRRNNLGCKLAVSSAITWFFEHEEQGIILEDDCLPSPSFFTYATYLLERFKNVDSVMHINGVNFQDGNTRSMGAYYFSKISHVWGWATWRRAWHKYDIGMHGLEDFFYEEIYKSVINYPGARSYWRKQLFATKNGAIDTWDYQWTFSIWKANGLCITPEKNLVENIGFGEDATHTKVRSEKYSSMKVEAINMRDDNNPLLIANFAADQYTFLKHFKNLSIAQKILPYVRRTFSSILHK